MCLVTGPLSGEAEVSSGLELEPLLAAALDPRPRELRERGRRRGALVPLGRLCRLLCKVINRPTHRFTLTAVS